MDKKISVIVPIYNVEKYLRQCIDSIINQTYKNLEIILVNDGSPDNCGAICDEYSSKDERIKVIHKKNGGLSDARNVGLEIASGDFISFVDSDDWIDIDTYEIMMNNIIKYNANIAVSNINYVYDEKSKPKYDEENIHIFNREEAMNELIHDGLVQAVVWNKIYKKELLDNMQFKVGKLNEDEFFTYKICARAEKIVYIPNILYQYRQRENSIMSNYSIKRLDGVEALYERLQFIRKEFPHLYVQDKLIFCYACIYHYQMILRNRINDKQSKNILINYRKSIKFYKKDVRNYNLKDKIYIFISFISLDMCCRLRNKLKIGY